MTRPKSSPFKDEKGEASSSKGRRLPIDLLRRIFSGVFITISIVLFLVGLSEIIVYLIDRVMGDDNYVSWERSFIAPWILSAISLAFYILLNIGSMLRSRKDRTSQTRTGKIEIPDLD